MKTTVRKFTSKGQWWTIRLRNVAGWSAKAQQDLGFNTMKFTSYEAALARCRQDGKNPIDFVICLTAFTAKDVKVREIVYDSTTLADALVRYGAHDLECSTDGCTCGFDGALAFAKYATDAPATADDIKRTQELAKQHGGGR